MKLLFLNQSFFSIFFFLNFSIILTHSIRTTPKQTKISIKNHSNHTITSLKNHFHRFGYLAQPESNNNSANFTDQIDSKFKSAILLYQSNLGLPVTGNLDHETLTQISSPRCGQPDTTPLTLSTLHGISNFTTKQRYVYFTGKPRWAGKTPISLTYAFSPNHRTVEHLNASDVRRVFRRAFGRWSAVVPVSFSEETRDQYGFADVKIGFYSGSHGDSEPFDGPLGVLGHSFSPENGHVHLDAAERWAVDLFRREGSVAAMDLESVAIHEIGHVLGLGHSSVREAVMFPSLKPRETKLVLKRDDVEGVQGLYGSLNPKAPESLLLESDVWSSSSLSVGFGYRWCFLPWWCFVFSSNK